MSFIDTIVPAASTGEVREMYLRQQSSWGYIPNYAKVFSHRPEVLARWGRLLAEIRRPMDARRFELITFAAAHELRNSACALAHGRALSAMLGSGDMHQLASGTAGPGLSAGERAMMGFARQVARDASAVTAADVAELRGHGYDDGEIFDIAATAAGRAFFTKLLDALGVQPDAPFQDMEPALREPLTVGRPIDRRAPEVLPVAP